MRKIIFHLETGYVGMESTEYGLYPDDVTDEELNEDAWHRAIQHAETYGIYPESDLENFSSEEMEDVDTDSYSYNIDGWWEDYDPAEHDDLVAGGGEWQWL